MRKTVRSCATIAIARRERSGFDLRQVDAVNGDLTLAKRIEFQQQRYERGFAAARRAEKRGHTALFQGEAGALKAAATVGVDETDIAQDDLADAFGDRPITALAFSALAQKER